MLPEEIIFEILLPISDFFFTLRILKKMSQKTSSRNNSPAEQKPKPLAF
jgi:hypothetical protein